MSAKLPRLLAELQRVASPGGRRELEAFSMEGTRLVERALGAEVDLRAVLCSQSYGRSAREARLLSEIHGRGFTLVHGTDEQLQGLTCGRSFGDILALATLPAAADLNARLFDRTSSGEFHPGALVVIDATDPGNVGALLRTALASGARAFVSVGSSDPFHPKAVRTSMGSLFRLPICHFETCADFLAARDPRLVLCGALARGGQPLRRFRRSRDLQRPIALCVGSEAFGLQPQWLEPLDVQLTIPMPPGVDSLSINAAAAVALYELLGN